MRILIIGGTGLISTATVRTLLARGDDVTVLNRNQSDRPAPPRLRRITCDRRDFAAFESAVRDAGTFDAVIDMVCYTPVEAESLARACRGRTPQVILCSTVDVYTKPAGATRHPVPDDEPHLGQNDYGRNKVAAEAVLRAAAADGAFALTVLRPAHTYDDRGALVHAFGWGTAYLDRLRRGLPVIVHGDGTSLWCQAHADDVGPAFAAAAGNPRALGRQYNVSGLEFLPWNQIYQTVCATLGWPTPALVHIPSTLLARLAPAHGAILLENFQFDNIFDNHAAAADLGYRYTVDLRQGTVRVVDWLTRHNGIAPAESQPWYPALLTAWTAATDEMVASFNNPRDGVA